MTKGEILTELINKTLDCLTADELFELCKQVSESNLSTDDELYKYFHDESNLKEGNK
jgi:hypothetical protein